MSYILAIACSFVALVVDRITKIYILGNMPLYDVRDFINGFINITHIKNTGGAWGILSGNTAILVVVTLIIMAVCIWLLIRYAKDSKLFFWAISLVLSGGLGNMIDRIFYAGKVVDFLQFDFWKSFPVFNIADCVIVLGCGLLILKFILEFIEENKQKKVSQND